MVPLFVFYLHTMAAVYAFTDQYQKEGVGAGALALAFMAIIFSVGWSISTFLLKLVVSEKGFGMFLNRDALSLALLTICEGVFYYLLLKGLKERDGKKE